MEIIPAIIEDLEKAKAEYNQLEREQEVMDSIQSDLFYLWGKDEQTVLIAELKAAQDKGT